MKSASWTQMDLFYADHTDMVHFGLSGFISGVLVHQSIAPQGLEDDSCTCAMTVGLVQ